MTCIYVSLTALAAEVGRSRDALRHVLANVPTTTIDGVKKYRLKDALDALYLRDAQGNFDPDKLDPYNRKIHYQAEREMLKVNEERGQLVRAGDVEAEIARIIKITVQELEPLPDLLERDTNMTPEQLELVETRINIVRESLYARYTQVPEHIREGIEALLEDDGTATSLQQQVVTID